MSSLTGAFTDAEQSAGEALAIGQQTGNPFASTSEMACIGVVRLLQGRFDELVEPLQQFEKADGWQPVWSCALAAVHAQRGDHAEAGALLFQLLPDNAAMEAWHRTDWWLYEMACLALTASELGDTTRHDCCTKRSTRSVAGWSCSAAASELWARWTTSSGCSLTLSGSESSVTSTSPLLST